MRRERVEAGMSHRSVYRSRTMGGIGIALALLGLFCTLASATDWYVATNGTGTGTGGWGNATNDLQGAIFAASSGDTVWASNGVYNTGAYPKYAGSTTTTSNRIVVADGITVRSLNNDRDATIIEGWYDTDTGKPGGIGPTNGPASIRCAYVAGGGTLIGFTLTNGSTRDSDPWQNDPYGGGAYGRTGSVISNCLVTGCTAVRGGGINSSGEVYDSLVSGNIAFTGGDGGGIYGAGVFSNCTVVGNASLGTGGGAGGSTVLYDCVVSDNSSMSLGGGASGATLHRCTLSENSTASQGGGTWNCTLYSCLLIGNSGPGSGAASTSSDLYNCTVVSNTGLNAVYYDNLWNCIVYYNVGNNYAGAGTTFTNCCTTPTKSGWDSSNITDDPEFVDRLGGNFRLSGSSKCVDAGLNQTSWMDGAFDRDGRPRINGGTVDMGAYEFYPKGTCVLVR